MLILGRCAGPHSNSLASKLLSKGHYRNLALEAAKAPRGNPRPCLWGRAPGAYEPEHGAQSPQALIVRLVPGGVNGNRPRLNRLSEMLLRHAGDYARGTGVRRRPSLTSGWGVRGGRDPATRQG